MLTSQKNWGKLFDYTDTLILSVFHYTPWSFSKKRILSVLSGIA